MSWLSSFIKPKEQKFNDWPYAIVSERGLRDDMEDTFYCSGAEVKDQLFVGIYDGHGGITASQFAKDNLHLRFIEQIKVGKEHESAFKISYKNVSEAIPDRFCGSTAATIFMDGSTIYYAHAGDARIILVNADGINRLTVDHRVGNPAEEARVISLGAEIKDGYVSKGMTGIMPTRSLGDAYFNDVGIISTPETGKHLVTDKDKWLLIGTDGLFDFANDDEIKFILSEAKSIDETAVALKQLALEKNEGDDNLTFFLMKLFKTNSK